MSDLFTANIVLVYFVYGLAFFSLGLATLLQARAQPDPHSQNYLWLLSGFGLLHGVSEWVELATMLGSQTIVPLGQFGVVLKAASFAFLLQSGAEVLCDRRPDLRWLRALAPAALSAWLAFLFTIAIDGAGDPARLTLADIALRYAISFPGATLAAYALWTTVAAHLEQGRVHLRGAAAALVAYALVGGLIVPAAPFFPASAVNSDTLLATLGVPVPVLRTVCAIAIAGFLTEAFVVNVGQQRTRLLVQVETARNRLAAVIETMPAGMLVVEVGGPTLANRAAELLLGVPREEIRVEPPPGVEVYRATGSPYPPNELPLSRSLRSGEVVAGEEVIVQRPDGTRAHLMVNSAPLIEGQRISGALAAFLDITPIKDLERMREEFISVVAHDLRSPIAVIAGFTELLQKLPADAHGTEQEQRATENIRTSTYRLRRMVADLLDASRIEAHRLALAIERVDLLRLVRDVAERTAEVTGGHMVQVAPPEPVPLVKADPGRVEQILVNLLSNAAKYSYPGTPITVNLASKPGEALVSVTNRGPGIAPEDRERLFTRFHRTRLAKEEKVPGLGLGLYIAKGLVEAHGGRIWVESAEGDYATFHFTLPAWREGEETP